MISMSQGQKTIRAHIIAYILKTALILFGVMVVLSFAYMLFVGFTTDRFHVAEMIMPMILIIVSFVLGWLIHKKHPGHTIALLFLIMAYSLAVGGIAGVVVDLTEALSPRHADWIKSVALTIIEISWRPALYFPVFLIPLYFPTGKLLSSRWRVLVFFVLVIQILDAITVIFRPWPAYGMAGTRPINGIPGSELFFDTASNVLTILTVPLVLLIPTAIYLRYQRSQGVERVQMKWPLLAILLLLLMILIFAAFPDLAAFDAELGYPIVWSMLTLFPISIGIAILRYRLFDIDILINRTLVYGALSGALGLVYFGSLVLLQHVLPTESPISVVFSTLAIAALFSPLRQHIQEAIDKRFYRRKYDAEKVLAAFNTRLRDEVDLERLTAETLAVIEETMQPEHLSLWLKEQS